VIVVRGQEGHLEFQCPILYSILLANVAESDGLFHAGVAWSWRRRVNWNCRLGHLARGSLDAEQSDGLTRDDTVVQLEDFSVLSRPCRNAFQDHPNHSTLFKVASLDVLNQADKRLREELAQEIRETEYRSITIPRQRTSRMRMTKTLCLRVS
jgi:hypothetical protein